MITFSINPILEASEAMSLLKRSDSRKPEHDAHRLVRIVPHANVVVTARDGAKLVGLARGLNEASGCCYLSDLLVDRDYQQQGIGEQLIRQVRKAVGDHALIVLIPAPEEMAYSTELD